MPQFTPGSEASVAACMVLSVLGGAGAGLSALMMPKVCIGVSLGTLVASFAVLVSNGVVAFWGETLLFLVAVGAGAVYGRKHTQLCSMLASSLFGGFLIAVGVDVFIPGSALLYAFAELFQLRTSDVDHASSVTRRGYLMPVMLVWLLSATAGFAVQSYATRAFRFWEGARRDAYDPIPDGPARSVAKKPAPAGGNLSTGSKAARLREVRYLVTARQTQAGHNLFKLDQLPAHLKPHAEALRQHCNALAGLFGFQKSSVLNQYEHLLVLLTNQARFGGSAGAIAVLHSRVFGNYRGWCNFLGVGIRLRADDDGMLGDLALFFCIWGEAANVRHMPEALCFLFHRCMEDVMTAAGRPSRPSEFFLETTIEPMYKAMKKRGRSGKVEHVNKLNYDDLNELFWSLECLSYGYIDADAAATFAEDGIEAQELRGDSLPSIAKGLEGASKTFVEHRSWMTNTLALWRIIEYHVLWFYVLSCIALANFLYWRWDFYVMVLSSVLLPLNLLPYCAELIEACNSIGRPLHGSLVSASLLRLAARFVVLVYQTMYIFWAFDGGSEVDAASGLRSRGNAEFWWWQFIWVSIPPLAVWALGLALQMYPPALTQLLSVRNEYLQALLAIMLPLSREYTAKAVHTPPRDTLRYLAFWVPLLAFKLVFSYYFEVMPLMTPSVNLYDDYMNYPYAPQHSFWLVVFRLACVWVPQFLIFAIDTCIWYSIWSAIVGVAIGFGDNLGEVRDYSAIRAHFMQLPNAFAKKVMADGVLRPSSPPSPSLQDRRAKRRAEGYGAVAKGAGRARGRGTPFKQGSSSYSPKSIGYRSSSTSREDLLRMVAKTEEQPLLGAPAGGAAAGEASSMPTKERSLRAPTVGDWGDTKEVRRGLREFLDGRTQRWVVFASAWNAVVDRMRASDLLSNRERDLMTFDSFKDFAKPVYLPVFVTAGALERAVDVIKAQAVAFREASNAAASDRSGAAGRLSEVEDALRHQRTIQDRLGAEVTWGEAASEAWELASWVLVRIMGPEHEEDLIEVVAFVEALSGFSPHGAGGRYQDAMALQCLRLEDVPRILPLLSKLIAALEKALKRRKGRRARPADADAQAAASTAAGMKKSRSGAEPSAVAEETKGGAEAAPSAGVVADKDCEAVRDALRSLLFACRGIIIGGGGDETVRGKLQRLRDRMTFVLKLEAGFFWNDAYAMDQLDVLARSHTARPVLSKLRMLMNVTSAEAEPAAPEAKRRLSFFVNSLFMDLPTAPAMRDMASWSVMTPYYSEDVAYNRADLEAKNNENLTRGVSILLYLQKLYPQEWANFIERTGAADDGTEIWRSSVLAETRRWASIRAQTLSRTVEGIMYYEDALRLLAQLEGVQHEEAEVLVRQKFTYVVSCQVYGRMRREGSPKADDIEDLMHRFPNLRIAYIDNVRVGREGDEAFYSVLVKSNGEGGVEECYRVRLPGNPVLGEGKPENQNHAIIFTRGEKLQAIDMNQDGYFEEALKMRCLLEEFAKHDVYAPRDPSTPGPDQHTAILGFREHIFTGSVSALANYMAMQETAFVSLGQRVLNNPLRMRLHYGHPDIFDKLFFLTRGGVSKASKGINLSEDIFAGYNCVTRGGQVDFKEYVIVGKGRDVGLMQTYKFEAKLAQGNAEQSLSRDVYRMSHRLDWLRLLSFYWGGIGHYVGSMLTIQTLWILCYSNLLLAIFGLEKIGFRRIVPIGTLQLILAGMGLLQTAPLFATLCIERGFGPALWEIGSLICSGSPLYFIFHIQTRAHYFTQTIMCGGAQYRATGRGFAIKHDMFDESYRFFASSHFYLGFDLAAALALFGATSKAEQYLGRSWALWLCVIAFLLTPFWFNPQMYEWEKVTSDYAAWLRWHAGSSGSASKSWAVWWREETAPYLKMRLSQRCLVAFRGLMYIAVGAGIIGSGTMVVAPGALSDTEAKELGRVAILTGALIVGYLAVDIMGSSVSYGVRRGAKMVLSVSFIICVIVLAALQSSYLTYAVALYYIFGGLSTLMLLTGSKALLPLVRLCNRVHDLVLGHVLILPVFVLAAIQLPSHIQTYLLFGNALSSGVVIDDILQKARTRQLARASQGDDSDDVKQSLARLEAIVQRQQRLLNQIATGEVEPSSVRSALQSVDSIGSNLSSEPSKLGAAQGDTESADATAPGAAAAPTTFAGRMTAVQSSVDIAALAKEEVRHIDREMKNAEAEPVPDFQFSQPAKMPPRT